MFVYDLSDCGFESRCSHLNFYISFKNFSYFPANICLNEDVLRLRLQKTSSRRLQDEYARLNLTSSEDVLVKANIFVLVIRLQDDFKTFPRCLAKTSSRRLAKTYSRRFKDVLQRYFQDVFKTYHQVKLFLLTCLREVFNTFLRYFFPKTVIYRSICLGNTTSEKFMATVQNLKER